MKLLERIFLFKGQNRSIYNVEQVGVTVDFFGGKLNEVSYSNPATVKKYTRHAHCTLLVGF